MFEKIPRELRQLDQWVGALKSTKIPVRIDNAKCASTANKETWGKCEDGIKQIFNRKLDYLGFVFTKDDPYIGIDLDKGIEKGLLSPIALEIISKCKSYTETSRSGRGFHIFLKGKLPISGRNNEKEGIEIYDSGRYFITTGKQVFFENIIENQEAIDYIVKKYFPDVVKAQVSDEYRPSLYPISWEKPAKGFLRLKPVFDREIPKGCRNQSIASVAGQLFKAGYTKDMVEVELHRCNEEKCVPMLPEREIQTILRSTGRYQN